MNDYAAFFNPELENILQEIARDPKAKMLEVPSSGQLICATHDSRVGIAAPGLTSAEVELLEVHREALGELLKQRCLIEFFAAPGAETRLHRSLDANRRLEVGEEASWRWEVKQALEIPVADERSEIAVDALARCVAKSDRVVSIAQLAAALFRVTSTDFAHVYMAIDFLERDRFKSAINAYEYVLSGGSSPFITSYCYEGASVAHWKLGRFSEAKNLIRKAVFEYEGRPVPIINWIDISSRLGEIKEAMRACSLLDELDCGDHSVFNWYTDHEKARSRGVSMIPLSGDNRSRIQELLNTTGPRSREVLHAILI